MNGWYGYGSNLLNPQNECASTKYDQFCGKVSLWEIRAWAVFHARFSRKTQHSFWEITSKQPIHWSCKNQNILFPLLSWFDADTAILVAHLDHWNSLVQNFPQIQILIITHDLTIQSLTHSHFVKTTCQDHLQKLLTVPFDSFFFYPFFHDVSQRPR